MCATFARADPPGIALVIGNAAYTALPPLPACARSAAGVATALRNLGFEVTERIDAPAATIVEGLNDLARKLDAKHPPAVLYACGYVAGSSERAYLLPVMANIQRPADVPEQGIVAKRLLDAVARGGNTAAVFAFDAIARPGDSDPPGLESLVPTKVTPGLAIVAARSPPPSQPETAFGAALTKILADPVVRSDGLVTNLDDVLFGAEASLEIKRLPSWPGYVAGAPKPVPNAGPAVPRPIALPDENRMTDQNRRDVQAALSRLGLYSGPITGRFDDATRSAINVYQIKMGVPMTGRLTGSQATQLVAGDR